MNKTVLEELDSREVKHIRDYSVVDFLKMLFYFINLITQIQLTVIQSKAFLIKQSDCSWS